MMRKRLNVNSNNDLDQLLTEVFTVSEDELAPFFEKAYKLSRERFSDKLAFHAPGMVHFDTEFYTADDPYRVPSISVSGSQCSLNCEHCSGKLLETMISATTPEALWDACKKVKDRGGKGCLISGGSTPRGNTPMERFIPTIKRVKKELGIDVVVHTGVVYPDTVEGLRDAGIDGAMLDIIGSDETLREIYHLDLTADVFDKSMELLEDNGIPMMPHIVVGLHHGKLLGEMNAIKMIAKYKPSSIIVVAFMPLDMTPMENVTPSSPMDIARVVLATRLAMPDQPVILGCARPHGEHRRETDKLCLKAGVNGIAYPTEEGYYYAKELGLKITMSDKCCSLMDEVL